MLPITKCLRACTQKGTCEASCVCVRAQLGPLSNHNAGHDGQPTPALSLSPPLTAAVCAGHELEGPAWLVAVDPGRRAAVGDQPGCPAGHSVCHGPQLHRPHPCTPPHQEVILLPCMCPSHPCASHSGIYGGPRAPCLFPGSNVHPQGKQADSHQLHLLLAQSGKAACCQLQTRLSMSDGGVCLQATSS